MRYALLAILLLPGCAPADDIIAVDPSTETCAQKQQRAESFQPVTQTNTRVMIIFGAQFPGMPAPGDQNDIMAKAIDAQPILAPWAYMGDMACWSEATTRGENVEARSNALVKPFVDALAPGTTIILSGSSRAGWLALWYGITYPGNYITVVMSPAVDMTAVKPDVTADMSSSSLLPVCGQVSKPAWDGFSGNDPRVGGVSIGQPGLGNKLFDCAGIDGKDYQFGDHAYHQVVIDDAITWLKGKL